MEINGKTRVIGLIGNPIEHTLSPVIHNNLSDKLAISSVYVPYKVSEEGILDAIKGAYELNILGLNVTVPHKNAVMDAVVDLDDGAKYIGAVNTLVRDEEKRGYKGYNTDFLGLQRQIQEEGIQLYDNTVVILGAGGAAKAVVYMCLLEGAKRIYLLNRTIQKAEEIAKDMNQLVKDGHFFAYHTKNNDTFEEEGFECEQHIDTKCDLVIPMNMSDFNQIDESNLVVFQATSIGLHPNENEVVITDHTFYKKIAVGIDLIYNPANTRFMQLVREAGGKAYNALKMLLYQGVIAYELWHSIQVPQDIIDDIYVELKRNVYTTDNIVLIGFMGSGKTTFGTELAKKLGMDFLDTDCYIEEQEGMTIAQIFEKKGEAYFRELETRTLRYLRDTVTNTVFSTGGGMPLRIENARVLKEIGTVFYLKAAPQVIYERVKNDTKRPLLQCDNPYERICKLMQERNTFYLNAADVPIDTNSTDIEAICREMMQCYKRDTIK